LSTPPVLSKMISKEFVKKREEIPEDL